MASQQLKGVWKQLSNYLSSEIVTRSSHSVNILKNKIYIFGGEHDSRIPINNCFSVFDLKGLKWSTIENKADSFNIPCSRVAHTSCLINDKIYIFGGRTGVGMGDGAFNDLYEFDTSNNQWKLIDDGKSENAPLARSYHAMTSLNNRIFIFGGCAKDRLNDFYSFDLSKKEWKRLVHDDRIKPRGGSAICAYKSNIDSQEYIYLIGGFCGKELDDCFVYNVKDNNWSQIANLPIGLSVFASATVDDNKEFRLIVQGGEIGPSKDGHKVAGEFSNSTFVYNGENWQKVETAKTPIPHAWHAGTYSEGKFYVYGGMLENSDRSGELFELELKF